MSDNKYFADPKTQAIQIKSLGSKQTTYYDKPSADILETFPNSTPERNYLIEFGSDEVTSLCPKTGQPDFAKFNLRYIAGDKCIESKSLKLLLFSLRGHQSFMETICNYLLTLFVEACEPRGMVVTMNYFPRGGISTDVIADYLNPNLPENVKIEVADKLGLPCVSEFIETDLEPMVMIDPGITDRLDTIAALLATLIDKVGK